MVWTPLFFGKHKGKTLPQVIFCDPDWFFWAYEDGAFNEKGHLTEEAEEIYRKATSIKIPHSNDEQKVVEYFIHPDYKKFAAFEIVPKSKPSHNGKSPTIRSSVIDFRIVRKISKYDKLGGNLFISQVKHNLFGNSNYRMTKKRCEEFFNNDNNFVLR